IQAKDKSIASLLKARLSQIQNEFVLLTSAESILNPQSLFIFKKYTQIKKADLYLMNSVLLTEDLRSARKYIRRALPSSIDLLGSAVAGWPVLLKRSFLEDFFSQVEPVST